MKVINCKVADEYVQGAGVAVGAAGSHDDVALRLTFSPMWDGTSKKITWLDARGENPTLTVLTTNLRENGASNIYLVPVPAPPKAISGQMMMTICGVKVQNEIETSATVTATAYFTVLESRLDPDAEETQDITPTQAEQMQAEIEAQVQRIENMTASAVKGTNAGVNVTVGEASIALAFTLPKGDKGDTGAQGAKGDKGDPGDSYTLTEADKAEIAAEAAEAVDNIKEACLTMGGKHRVASLGGPSPIDACMIDDLHANRLAFLNPDDVTIEYSRDGGTTWVDYGATDAEKVKLFTTEAAFYIGGQNPGTTPDYKLRVTVSRVATNFYFNLQKIALYVSTQGNTGCNVIVEYKQNENADLPDAEAYQLLTESGIDGWSGWNILNINNGGIPWGSTANGRAHSIRLTFGITGVLPSYEFSLIIYRIRALGITQWFKTSNMATNGHLYAYDENQNAVFPAKVTAPQFDGTATKAISDQNGNNIANTYVSKSSKVTSITSSATDEQYPSAKAVYDMIGDVDTAIAALNAMIGGTA